MPGWVRSRPRVDAAQPDANPGEVVQFNDVGATEEQQEEPEVARGGKKMAMLAYKPVGLLLGAGAGLVAGAVFKRTWKTITHQDDTPLATDKDRGWTEVLLAAALQGVIFAVVKAVIDRAGATGMRRATGYWPG
jgi:hypothetical protein